MPRALLNLAEQTLEVAGIGGWELDVASNRLHWSPLTFRIFELEPTRQPTREETRRFYPPEALSTMLAAVTEAIRTGAPWQLELPIITARGRHIWVRACGLALREHGRTVKLFGSLEDITARRDMAEREARLSMVAGQMTNVVMMLDRTGRLTWVNEAFTRLTGWTLEEIRGRRPREFLNGADTDPAAVRTIDEGIREGRGYDVEILNYRKDGRTHWMSVIASPMRDASGSITGFVSVETDVTARRNAEELLRREAADRERTEALLRDVLDALPSAVIAWDSDERLILVNRAYVELFPIAARFAEPGRNLEEFVRLKTFAGQFPEAGTTPAEREDWIRRQVAEDRMPGPPRTLRLPDGRFVLARERRSETGNLVCVRTDTTDLMRAEADLRVQAECDPLTLLANRPTFLAALERSLALTPQHEEAQGVLVLLDVDYFKQINDTLGHDCGDALLVEIAVRLRAHLRASDVAARLGGDEFGVVMPGLVNADSLVARMDAIHAALSAPVALAGRRLQFGMSVGVTMFPTDGIDAAKLLKNADLALYEAKRNGRGRWSAFRPDQAAALERHVRVADALRDALAQQRITIALQPKRSLRGGGHAGFEALSRWHDGTRWVSPVEFIPVAEDTGLIGPLGRAVMDASLARVSEIRDAGLDPGRVAVNVTSAQLLDTHFADETLEALRRHGLGPADLELELTETVLFSRAADRIEAVLREFSRLGITLALDDFGTGHASLAHLSRLPIDRLKIDRSFVDGIGKGGPGGVIARTVISLAHSLEMESIAEGVETTEQLAFLESAGCDAAQGYLFARPLLTTAQAIEYLRTDGALAPAQKRAFTLINQR